MTNDAKVLARAKAVLKSWLVAIGQKPVSEGEGVRVNGKYIGFGEREELTVNAAALSKNSIEEFHKVTRFLGLGQPIPVDRGVSPKSIREDLRNDFDLQAFRHREFRAAPNPSAEEMKKYQKTIDSCSLRFYRSHLNQMRCRGLEVEDLKTYATIWTINFLHRYKMERAEDENTQNNKLLNRHLRQRFNNLSSLIDNRQETVVDPRDDKADRTLYGEWVDYLADIKTSPPKDRVGQRERAKNELTRLLGEMEHDKFIYTLAVASGNYYLHVDARTMAAKLLRQHLESCAICQKKEE